MAGRLGHWSSTGIRYVGLGKGCSAHGDAISGDLGPGSLGPLLSYHFLGTYCMPETFHGFSNLTVIILQTHFTDRCVQGAGLGMRSREDCEGVKWRLRDVWDLLRHLSWKWNWKPGPLPPNFLLYSLPLCLHLVDLQVGGGPGTCIPRRPCFCPGLGGRPALASGTRDAG